jgi:hypothetical protein
MIIGLFNFILFLITQRKKEESLIKMGVKIEERKKVGKVEV